MTLVGFLTKLVSQWKNDSDYLDGKKTIHDLMIVNDLAERGVKQTTDYLDTAKIEECYQDYFQVVETSRKTTRA